MEKMEFTPGYVKQLRLSQGFTQKQFADKLNVSESTIKNIERGKTKISPNITHRLNLYLAHPDIPVTDVSNFPPIAADIRKACSYVPGHRNDQRLTELASFIEDVFHIDTIYPNENQTIYFTFLYELFIQLHGICNAEKTALQNGKDADFTAYILNLNFMLKNFRNSKRIESSKKGS